ncbi:hypothetical protein BSZ37_19455 [Rubrivirga marina]|uniref:Uncharacterized protein n=1 Tax=Rubrivirga marina TaxID=1196024 RepID=A0A271J665_9BACT|nr:hypothetical protein BSZ37_19455 [Rubrivirga marina]
MALLAVALWGCDAAPGFASEVARPTLGTVDVSPVDVSLDTDAPTATVPLAVTGTLGGEGTVRMLVLVRYAETDSLVTQTEAEVQPGDFRVDAPFDLPRGAIGEYSVRVATEGADGRAGDQAAAVFRFVATNLGPPSVTANTPSPVSRPSGTNTARVPLVATVTDPDGRANIAAVVAVDPESGVTIGRLFDDGPAGGAADQTADDGRYSASVTVTSDFEPGTYELAIVAVDKYGAESEPALYTFTVR